MNNFKKNYLALNFSNKKYIDEFQFNLSPLDNFQLSKTGEIVPTYFLDGHQHPLHSLYDPKKEASRVIETLDPTRCLVIMGAGGLFLVEEALKNSERELIALWDPFPEESFRILNMKDFSTILSDPRLYFLKSPADLKNYYSPIFQGSLKVLTLSSLERLAPDIFLQGKTDFALVLEDIKGDQATQGRLGSRWMKNSWENLNYCVSDNWNFPKKKKIWVIGAGPNLETQIQSYQPEDLVFASDTAAPFLCAKGIVPDLIMTLDPQIYSYLHYLPLGKKPKIFCELGVFPGLSPEAQKLFFFSDHPLHKWMEVHGLIFPKIKSNSGNVTGALLNLADNLKPEKIILAGADFSYPQGKIYARGTYQYQFHTTNTNRLAPLEGIQITQIFQGNSVSRVNLNNTQWCYISQQQREYQGRIEQQGITTEVIIPSETVYKWNFKKIPDNHFNYVLKNDPCTVSKLKWSYYTEVSKLNPKMPFLTWKNTLNNTEILVWDSLTPWLIWRKFHGLETNLEKWPIILEELKVILDIEGN